MEIEPPSDDNLARGFLFGCLFQLGFFLLGLWGAWMSQGKLSSFFLVSWGLTQWIALGPLIWRQRANGYSKTVKGLIITGCIGLLLSSGCAKMLFK